MATYNVFNLFVHVGGLNQVVNNSYEFHEAMLIVSDDIIRLDVKFSDRDKISNQMGTWNNEINVESWGKFVVCENNKAYNNNSNESVYIDFSNSKLLTYKSSIDSPYISFFIDYIKYSYDYPTNKNEAIFWLNDAGYKFIQDYYNVEWGIELPKRIKIEAHNILGTKCEPYFDFHRSNGGNSREIIIQKTPKIKWYNFSDVESVVKYNRWICQLASLFYSNNINYKGGRIDFNNTRTIIYQILPASTYKSKNTFLYFKGLQHIYQFLNSISYELYQKFEIDFGIITERFVQSSCLNASTQYLVLYNILELCKKIDISTIKGDTDCNKARIKENQCIKKEISRIKDELKLFFKNKLDKIKNEEMRKLIEARCNAASTKLDTAPSSFIMEKYIAEQGFKMDAINKHVQKDMPGYNFFQLRSPIIHGSSINAVTTVNDILSHIGKILTLKLLGCPIQVSEILAYSDIYKKQ